MRNIILLLDRDRNLFDIVNNALFRCGAVMEADFDNLALEIFFLVRLGLTVDLDLWEVVAVFLIDVLVAIISPYYLLTC